MARSFAPKYFSTSAARAGTTAKLSRFTFARYADEPNYLALHGERNRIRIPDEITGRAATPVIGATGFGRSRLPGIDPSVVQESARALQQAGPFGHKDTGTIFANKIRDTFNIGETFERVFRGTVDPTGSVNVDTSLAKEKSKGLWGRIFG